MVGRLRAEDAAAVAGRSPQVGGRDQSDPAETHGDIDKLRGMESAATLAFLFLHLSRFLCPPAPPFPFPANAQSPVSHLCKTQLHIHEIVHDAPKGKAVIYASSRADTPFGDFKWTNEYAVFLSFTEDGEQINRNDEMVDTAFYHEFFPKFMAHVKEQQALSNRSEGANGHV